MRKIKDLNGDEFFDFVYAISPILPLVLGMEIVRMQFLGEFNELIREQQAVLRREAAKEKSRQKAEVRDAAIQKIGNETAALFARDIAAVVPKLCSKEYRAAVYDALAILEGVEVAEIRAVSASKLVAKIHQVIRDVDINDFLHFAPPPDVNE